MYACEMYACEMYACEMYAREMYACEMHAREMHARKRAMPMIATLLSNAWLSFAAIGWRDLVGVWYHEVLLVHKI